MSDTYDIAIIGAGPAGLSLAYRLSVLGKNNFILIDKGNETNERKRNSEFDSICGIGGAGLYSDGKFSFFPSSTKLWNIFDHNIANKGLDFVMNITGFDKDQVNYERMKTNDITECKGEWFLKEYPSFYLPLDNRILIIDKLYEGAKKGTIKLGCSVNDIQRNNENYALITSNGKIKARKIVICGGRFASYNKIKIFKYKFMRLEYGVRIVENSKNRYFQKSKLLDPKYKLINDDGSIEYRTFCCCRRGETVCTNYKDDGNKNIRTFSGRADCQPTDESNIGFNVRIINEKIARNIELNLGSDIFVDVPISEALDGSILDKYYGKIGSKYLVEGLKSFISEFPELSNAKLCGPTIEGIGSYIETDDNSNVPNEEIWVIGDASGKYRGLTSALISGYCIEDSLF